MTNKSPCCTVLGSRAGLFFIIPAHAGIQQRICMRSSPNWMPAFAGMTRRTY
jgi:hypothetical protein